MVTYLHRYIREKKIPVILGIVLFISFLLVLFRIKDYGLSDDEPLLYRYAAATAHSYKNIIFHRPPDNIYGYSDHRYYGPAYLAAGYILVELLSPVLPMLTSYDLWHLVNFSIFLAGAVFIYALAGKFVSRQAALFAAVLYVTQPLLWGHGVMNSKDSPFMVMFLAAVYTGMEMIDRWEMPRKNVCMTFLKRHKKNPVAYFLLFGITVWLALAVGRTMFNSVGQTVLSPVGTNEGSLIYLREFIAVSLLGLIFLIFLLRTCKANNRWFIYAGMTLGLATAIRVIGPAVLALLLAYLFMKGKIRVLWVFVPYVIVSAFITYVSWPFLWTHPVQNFVSTIFYMMKIPWTGTVRFEGQNYLPAQLPWYYLPKLITIQLTIPVILCSLTGIFVSVYSFLKRRDDANRFWILLIWTAAPVFLTIIVKPVIYDNFRQYLFAIPPLFIFAGIAFDRIFRSAVCQRFASAVFVVFILPGVVAGIWLHPYEYVYYNGFVGWTGAITRLYEADYWDTGFCEAARIIGSQAPGDITVGVTENIHRVMLQNCTHSNIRYTVERKIPPTINPDYSVVTARYDDDMRYFRSMKTFRIIGRGRTPFIVIKKNH